MLKDGHEVDSFKDDKKFVDREPIVEVAQNHSITDSEHIETMRLIILPLTIDILAMADVD